MRVENVTSWSNFYASLACFLLGKLAHMPACVQVVRPSIVGQDGGFKSRTRTSENGWLRRSRTEVLETVHRRFADALGLPESMVRWRIMMGKGGERLV